ncbi:MAG: tail fiber domain-containing protein [Halovenus sp.]
MADNHDYNTPERGTVDWHEPLNENFERLDTDIEIRDTRANRGEYERREGAKFFATDTGVVYACEDVSGEDEDPQIEWVRRGVIAQGDSFANETLGPFAVVYGGLDNRASGPRSVVLGGKSNLAAGRSAIAAGKRARAVHDGAVVFGDHTSSTVSSRSSGELRSQMPIYAPSFNTTSARLKKTDIEPFDPEAALDGVQSLDVRTWRLAGEGPDAGRHVGPMAGDFHEQFDLGERQEAIATVDADGVALAAIQALSRKVDEQKRRVEKLERETDRIDDLEAENERKGNRIEELEDRLAALEAEVGDTERDPADG